MANTIIPKRSSVAGKVPATTDLVVGEIAVNLTDKKLFVKDATGAVVELGGGGGGGTVDGVSATRYALDGAEGSNATYTYTDGYLTQVVDTVLGSPRTINYTYSNGAISSVSVSYGGMTKTTTYTLDASGTLVSTESTEA